jgi:hypothetical protein
VDSKNFEFFAMLATSSHIYTSIINYRSVLIQCSRISERRNTVAGNEPARNAHEEDDGKQN